MGGLVIRYIPRPKGENRSDNLHQEGVRLKRIKEEKSEHDELNNQQGGRGSRSMLWTRAFLQNQVFDVEKSTLYQDNVSTMLLEKKGRVSSLRKTKHIEIRYFCIQDRIEKGGIVLE